ncbi:hypothetical protein HYPSUDRAFT_971646 [Hypholoma sublateritium FD-334 SS-4]|uniref:Uncharacterized protein n=1 Tax=Hypholoma sublateritium (strain FD-334 SS-4) TaxID=945553 RepID=A0A0D2NMV7_HYPSF|nr:hypothetical protein HYPSUDRAFT_971646 [Hypholoma sublateritium FD-334 SS-4]
MRRTGHLRAHVACQWALPAHKHLEAGGSHAAASVTRRAAAPSGPPKPSTPRFSRALLKLNLMSGRVSSGEVTCRPLNEDKTAGTPQHLGVVPAEQFIEMLPGRHRIWLSHGRRHPHTRIRLSNLRNQYETLRFSNASRSPRPHDRTHVRIAVYVCVSESAEARLGAICIQASCALCRVTWQPRRAACVPHFHTYRSPKQSSEYQCFLRHSGNALRGRDSSRRRHSRTWLGRMPRNFFKNRTAF